MDRTEYLAKVKRARLTREIEHFQRQIRKFAGCATPQEKRCHTIALRALHRRAEALAKLPH